ncbi:MAG: hypothetical protein IV298_06545 [Cylindrospermopsis raciborskii KL1]|nr:hypothetical protein [Cylindrospermopsis raciborskii]MBG0743132.1 hypothetical protein [Cylindrospermopsis raciborskii KL1]
MKALALIDGENYFTIYAPGKVGKTYLPPMGERISMEEVISPTGLLP